MRRQTARARRILAVPALVDALRLGAVGPVHVDRVLEVLAGAPEAVAARVCAQVLYPLCLQVGDGDEVRDLPPPGRLAAGGARTSARPGCRCSGSHDGGRPGVSSAARAGRLRARLPTLDAAGPPGPGPHPQSVAPTSTGWRTRPRPHSPVAARGHLSGGPGPAGPALAPAPAGRLPLPPGTGRRGHLDLAARAEVSRPADLVPPRTPERRPAMTHRPVKTAFSFARNAVVAERWSAVAPTIDCWTASCSNDSARSCEAE